MFPSTFGELVDMVMPLIQKEDITMIYCCGRTISYIFNIPVKSKLHKLLDCVWVVTLLKPVIIILSKDIYS
jgi:hypothetical protein